MDKCSTCNNRYDCDGNFEFSCKNYNYMGYSKDNNKIKENTEIVISPESIFTSVYNPEINNIHSSIYFDGCTGVRLLHRETGIEIKCHKESTLTKNRDLCLEGLIAMLKK